MTYMSQSVTLGFHSSIIIPTGKSLHPLFIVINVGFKERLVSLSYHIKDSSWAKLHQNSSTEENRAGL